ncbi:MAG: 7-cyano-7-deazaguanine synthase QueC [Ignavibacteriae bacterium]|nr:MAG: 7-cyano-7-deazaguanine synthase QueC [Ignavibacteriota bacterium]
MNKKLAVVALSGGLDSCVTTAIACRDYEVALLHINYGQKTESRELDSFHKIAEFYEITKKLVIDFSHFHKIGGSSLTDKSMEIEKADLENKNIPNTYVPFRNANILSACVSWAEVIQAEAIFIGAVNEDSSGYPDCRPEFFHSFQQTVNLGTKPKTNIKIETPIINLNKVEIIKLGLELNTPLELTWSCYGNEKEACGVCDSCALRLRGFQSAGVVDPIPYKEIPNYTK